MRDQSLVFCFCLEITFVQECKMDLREQRHKYLDLALVERIYSIVEAYHDMVSDVSIPGCLKLQARTL